MMLHTLESEFLKISVNSMGAELQNLICKKTGTDYLWQGKAPYWQGRSPVLFPIVGRLKNGSGNYNGQKLNMDVHGFAQFCEFCVAKEPIAIPFDIDPLAAQRTGLKPSAFACRWSSQNGNCNNKLIFTLEDSPATRQVYPFAFLLEVIFTLEGNCLNTEYRVTNPSNTENLIFSIGGHPGFICPITLETEFSDHFLEFKDADYLSCTTVSPNGLLEDRTTTIHLNESRLPLSYDLFQKHDTIVLVDTPVKHVALKSTKSDKCISMTFDAQHLSVWTQQNAPFICLEPWDGLPDFEDTYGDFAKKKGNHTLPPGASKLFSHSININNA